MKLIFATRPSKLARWQTQWVITALQALHPNLECEEKIITTQGDKIRFPGICRGGCASSCTAGGRQFNCRQNWRVITAIPNEPKILDKPLPEIGGKGLFTQELESELLSGAVHCAVHSLKDLPVENPAGLTIGCIPARVEVRDALISRNGYTLATLPSGASVGTSSLRRAAQILSLRPDLRTQSLRGNVDTRLRKALNGQYDAIILAGAGLTRLGLDSYVTEWLSLEIMLPAPGQGALAVQCRADDDSTLALLSKLEDKSTRKAVTAERAFLQGLGGGCAVPVAAYAVTSEKSSVISLTGLVISEDGRKVVKVTGQSADALQIGNQLAQQAIAQGADEILKLITMKVLITRPRAQADDFAEKLRSAGFDPIFFPVIEIKPIENNPALDDALSRLDKYAWMLFTSVNAVEIVIARRAFFPTQQSSAQGRLLRSARSDMRPKIVAIGPKTAEALRKHGIEPDFIPNEYVGEAILSGLGDVNGKWILLPRAEIARKELPETIAAAGGIAHEIVVYRTLPAEVDMNGLAALKSGVDIITFTSASTVENFVAIARQNELDQLHLPNNPLFACIGPVTEQAAREAGFQNLVIAKEYTTDGLIHAITHLEAL